MKEYQGFAISNFRKGLDEAVEPWLLPHDAYQSVINARLYRGVLERVDGYNLYASMSARNQISLGVPDGLTQTFTATLSSVPITNNFYGYGTIVVGLSAEIFTYQSDASATVINLTGSAGGTGTLDLVTLDLSLTFNTAPPMSAYSCVIFQWDSAPSVITAIMGIKQYYLASGTSDTLIFDERRMGLLVPLFGTIAVTAGAAQGISEVPHDYYQSAVFTGDGATVTFTSGVAGVVALHAPIAPGTVRFYPYTSTGAPANTPSPGLPFSWLIEDDGAGVLSGPNVVSASSTVNYDTGAYTITFSVAPALNDVFDATTGAFGDFFTGSVSNFFTLTNYQDCAFFTNSVDPVFYYDGVSIHYLNTSLATQLLTSSSGVPTNLSITKALHVAMNRDRLLLLAPTLQASGALLNYIFWSTALNPFDFTQNNNLPAPTSQPIKAFSFINTDLIVRFSQSERVFRYTGDAFSPFRWDSTNNLWACDAPYGVVNYDTWFASVGRPAIVGSDGVNVRRADEIIPDFTSPYRLVEDSPVPYMSQNNIQQCYGERFDDLKEGWICYNSAGDTGDVDANITSTNVLSFNYLDETYATYNFPFSCLGFTQSEGSTTWRSCFTEWQYMNTPWRSYQNITGALLDLGGDQYDRVYQLNTGNSLTLAGDATCTPYPVLFDVITKNFNPFIDIGQLARLGYVDLFVSADADTKLRVQFFLNDQLYIDGSGTVQGFYQENILTFTPTDAMSSQDQQKVWKRIYVGATGKEHTLRFYQNADDFTETFDQPVYIHGMVLYFKPAGRIFN